MKLAHTSSSMRRLGAIAFCALIGGIGAGTALADPAARTHDYYGQIAAGTRPDDRGGVRGVNGALATAPSGTAVAVRPDDRGGLRGIDPTIVAAPAVSVGGGSGFDWGAAGIGAASMLALVLVAGSAVLVRGHYGARSSRGSSTPPALHA